MRIVFDAENDAANQKKHGLPLADAGRLDLMRALVVPDNRRDYGEQRMQASGRIDGRLHVLAFRVRGDAVRAISFRKATAERNSVMASDVKDRDPEAIDDVDNPELTTEDFERARPFAEVFPDLAESLKRRGSRQRVERPKVKVAWRLAADVVDAVKASGKGYNARVEKVLRDAIAKGIL